MSEHDDVLYAKVLTVSDGVIAGTREDKSGEALGTRLAELGYEVLERRSVADGVDSVAGALRELSEGFGGLVVSTGGTGFTDRDLTPEGTREVIEREAPGLAEAMRLCNPLGRLSRGVAGTIGRTLIVNTPGSTKGCVEQLDAVADILPHAIRLLVGEANPHPHGARARPSGSWRRRLIGRLERVRAGGSLAAGGVLTADVPPLAAPRLLLVRATGGLRRQPVAVRGRPGRAHDQRHTDDQEQGTDHDQDPRQRRQERQVDGEVGVDRDVRAGVGVHDHEPL